MLLRVVVAVFLAGSLGLSGTALAKGSPATVKDATPAKQRQMTCAAEWRGLSVSEKTVKGPKWPQFFNRCVKRLKAQKG